VVLELGGSDPFVVLGDADLDLAARAGAVARWQNTGQSCIAAKRFIVVEDVAAEFERRFVDAAAALKVGDPLAAETQVGPMARPDLREAIERQVRESVALGAEVVLGGERLMGTGYFFAPTILTNVSLDMPVLAEEVFGPVAAVVRARDVDHAVALANETEFGLGASIWTQDVERAKTLARRIEAGSVFVNALVASDPRLPFGGVKRSGYGRELGEFGILEFTNIQTIVTSDGGGISVTSLGSGK
jgi:succinate-semialdehyde dehydrogenase/glutarate-semialdehyde dehydrogenase